MTLYSRESLSAIQQKADISLGMAQLSVRGLSEDWWLKRLGDVHWQMIATAMGQTDPVFRDAQGLAAHLPLLELDFNAVGLLYFPSFTRIATEAEAVIADAKGPIAARLMVYFGNVEMGEAVRSAALQDTSKMTSDLVLLNGENGLLATCDSNRHPQKG